MIASLCIPNLHVRNYTCSGATQRRLRVAGEAERHEGGALEGRVENDKAARSVGGSHSLRITNAHHDRCRPEVAVA